MGAAGVVGKEMIETGSRSAPLMETADLFVASRMRRVATSFSLILLLSALTVLPGVADAQSVDEGLRLYKDGQYADATFAFYDVLLHDANPDYRDQAEIYLAESLFAQELYIPALFYFTDIFALGKSNRYYLNAIEGLLKVREVLHDSLFVPNLINDHLDAEGFGRLDPQEIARVNFMVGELLFRTGQNRDARSFLEFVPPDSQLYAKSRFLLGVLEIREGRGDDALAHFRAVIDFVPAPATGAPVDPELSRVRSMALVAAGRASYGLGRYPQSSEYYEQVPRFSDHWFEAIYESAWSYYKDEDYGRALGQLQSATSPYFAKRHIPEAYVISGNTYFGNCQWDRVRRSVATYKSLYEPMLSQADAYLESVEPTEVYRDIVNDGSGAFSLELARDVRRSRRFRDFHHMLRHMYWEREAISGASGWAGTRLADDLLSIVDRHIEEVEPAVGLWSHKQLKQRRDALRVYQSQIDILDFEVADAETRWLEQGREILKGRRARLPRPAIPNDQWQHWGFVKEYWQGELGYYHHSIRSECE